MMAALFSYDEGAHFISSLQLADQHLRQNQKDEANVRWVVIALHDALYALLIAKLTRTDGFGIYNDKFEGKVGEFYEGGLGSNSKEFHDLVEESFGQNLAGIGKLLQRAGLSSGAEIKVRDIQNLSRPSRGLSHLKEMRDFFAHPRPMLAGYYEDWLLATLTDTIEVIKEVIGMPGKRASRHDPCEAQVLLASIEYYLGRWHASAPT